MFGGNRVLALSNAATGKSRPNLVLIDDDELVRNTWNLMAQKRGHHFRAFENFEDFENARIEHQVPIYVDYQLEGGINGLEVLTRLHHQGYNELYLCTGYPMNLSDLEVPIKGVVKKNYPF